MLEPFVWGRAGSRKTPEEVARDREMADAMIAKGLDFSPVGSWTQGAARVATALAGVIKERRGTQAESEGRQSAADTIAALLDGAQGGGGDVAPPAASEANYAPGAVTAAQRQPAPESPGGIGSFTAAGGGAPGGVVYANQNAIRSQPIVPDLQASLGEAVQTVYGPGYTAQVYSGGQPAEGRRTGSVRHNGGRAADVYIVGPDGKRITGDALAPLGQYWAAKKYGGVGMEMHGGGIHLDDWSTPPPGGGMTWNYADKGGTYTPAMAAALEMGQKGQLPALNGQQATPASAPAPAAIQRVADAGPSIPQLMQAANNPWLSDGQKMVVGAMLKQAMERNAPPEYSTTFAPNGDLLRTDNRGGTPQVLGNYAKPDAPEKPLVIGGKLVDPKTYRVLGDFTPPPAKPADIQEYEYAKGQGFQGSFTDYQLALKNAGASNTTVTVGGDNSADSKLRNKLSDKEGESWAAYKDAGAVSGGMLQDMDALEALTTMAPQGPIEGRLAQAFPGMSSAGAAFQSIVKRVAPTLRAPGSGSTSDIEYDGMLASLPSLQNRPDANRAIAAMMKAKAQINVERAAIIDQYQNEHLTASEARSRIAALNKRSIMGPELKSLLSTLGRGQDGAPGPTDEPAPEGVDPELWQNLTPQERQLWQ